MPDTTPPIISAGSVYADGMRVLLTVTETSFPLAPQTGITGLSITGDLVGVNIGAASVTDGTYVTLWLDSPIYDGADVLLASTSSNLKDAANNFLADFSNFSLTNNSIQSPSTAAEWYYAAQSDLTDAMSSAGVQMASNMENTSTATNVARINRSGVFADAYMDSRLAVMGFTVPIDLTANTRDAVILKQISVALVMIQLCRWRLLTVVGFDGNPATTLEKFSGNWFKYANDMLEDISNGRLAMTATRSIAGPLDNADALTINGLPMYPNTLPGFGWFGGLAVNPL